MTTNANASNLWIIVSLDNRPFAIQVADVETMVMLPPVCSVPNAPPHVRGVINLRGKVLPVIDLRLRLGMPSLKDETDKLTAMLTQRETDHKNWLNELELSVKERREFKLATNPHLCAFGKWYDTFRTDNLLLSTLLKKFDEPHQRIHAIAQEVKAQDRAGNQEAAQRLIDHARGGDLAEMMHLFAVLRAAMYESLREIAVVPQVKGRTFAVTVDSVETVSRLQEGTLDDMRSIGMGLADHALVTSVGKLDKSDKLVLVLDTATILGA